MMLQILPSIKECDPCLEYTPNYRRSEMHVDCTSLFVHWRRDRVWLPYFIEACGILYHQNVDVAQGSTLEV